MKIKNCKINEDGTINVVVERNIGEHYEGNLEIEITRLSVNNVSLTHFTNGTNDIEVEVNCLRNTEGNKFMLKHPKLKPIEMTMEEIENRIGRPVKIVTSNS